MKVEWKETAPCNRTLASPDGKSTLATVWLQYDHWCWCVFVPPKVKLSPADGLSYTGRATSEAGAKRIVEVILEETGVLTPEPKTESQLSKSATRLFELVNDETGQALLNELGVTPGRPIGSVDVEEAVRRLAKRDQEPPDKMGYPHGS